MLDYFKIRRKILHMNVDKRNECISEWSMQYKSEGGSWINL